MHKRIKLPMMSLAACLMLASAWGILTAPGPALAGKPTKPSPDVDDRYLLVEVLDGNVGPDPFKPVSPVWAPTSLDPNCVAKTVGTGPAKYHFLFPDDPNSNIVTSEGAVIAFDVGCSVYMEDGCVAALRVRGRDVDGPDGIMYVSEVVHFEPVPPPPDGEVFVVPVRLDDIPIYRTNGHFITKKMQLVEMVGTISIGDIIFSPLPAE